MDDLSSVTEECIDCWIKIIHGLLMSQCEGTQEQFELLLDVVLTYHMFALGQHSLGEAEFDLFADRPIRMVSKLHPFKCADDELAELIGWLCVNFPKMKEMVESLDGRDWAAECLTERKERGGPCQVPYGQRMVQE
ncbi:hypothetical protein TRAPUB_2283 [Trametes pubescens]|uniref:Uncharacterized protein n=1 Tax=Trametes pubescens TaxID=154538 RepID=A0A1M2VH44_TRAPU|nr:hypothetical protein TRAPUB_2283 [Trametes pubescens]